MKKKLFLVASLIPLIILMYFSTQWFLDMSGIFIFAVIVIAQMIIGIMARLTGFLATGEKLDETTFNVFTEESYVVSIMFVSFGLVSYVIIDVLLSFVLEQENTILTFALAFVIPMGLYIELKRRGKLDFD